MPPQHTRSVSLGKSVFGTRPTPYDKHKHSTPAPRTPELRGTRVLAAYSISGIPAGRVVPRDEGAGHVSRPPTGPQEPSPDLDTAARSSRPTRSALGTRPLVPRRLLDQRMWVPAGRRFRWSSSAPRGTSRARVETSHRSAGTLTGSRHASSYLVGYSINGYPDPLVGPTPRLGAFPGAWIRPGTCWR